MPYCFLQSQQAADRPRFLPLICFSGYIITLASLSLSVTIYDVRPEGVLSSKGCYEDYLRQIGQKASTGGWAHGGAHSRHWLLGSQENTL